MRSYAGNLTLEMVKPLLSRVDSSDLCFFNFKPNPTLFSSEEEDATLSDEGPSIPNFPSNPIPPITQ